MAQKIIIASGKGGVGKSSVCVGLARALAARGRRVLVIDFDIGLRSLDILFGVSQDVLFDWGDILERRCDPKKAFLELQKDLYFIAAPLHMSDALQEENIKPFIEILNRGFHTILFDAPAGLQTGFQFAASVADVGIVVSTPDPVCVRSVGITAQELGNRGVDSTRLVINRIAKKTVAKDRQLNIDEVIDATGVQLLGVVPEDPLVPDFFCRGLPLPARATASEAFRRIAGRMTGLQIPLSLKW